MNSRNKLKVLVIDDSAYNRRAIGEILLKMEEVERVIKATDGQQGLQMAFEESPDVITLDLEMPRLDGFAFLRLIMAAKPCPVIVVSSHSNQESVFRALEFGALDFIAKPGPRISKEILEVEDEIVRKVRLAGYLAPSALNRLPSCAPGDLAKSKTHSAVKADIEEFLPVVDQQAGRVVVIAASTGGPQALTKIVSELPVDLQVAVVVVQHMPASFTPAFAARLNKQCNIKVLEATEMETLKKGTIYLAPGGKSVEITTLGDKYRLIPVEPRDGDRYTPCANRLFSSAARALKSDVMGVVLTGMGDDGAEGSQEIAQAGGEVIIESPETAVVDGMPLSVIRQGVVAKEEMLDQIPLCIVNFAATKN